MEICRMYPKDCCKIQPSDATTFQLITFILYNLVIKFMTSRFARGHEF